jgi:hypothetical protein
MNAKNDNLIGPMKANDVLTITRTILGFLATTIIYFDGWVYASSWYGFFNIDMTQIILPTPVLLIDGIPTLAVALIVFILSIFTTMVIKYFFQRSKLSRYDIPLLAFMSVVFFTISIFLLQRYLYPIILLETYVINGVTKYKFGAVQNSNVTGLVFTNDVIYAVSIFALLLLMVLIIAQIIVKRNGAQLPHSHRKGLLLIYQQLRRLSQWWQIGGAILLLVYLFMPMVLSSEIGRIDALRGRHLMSGSHLLPSVEIQSDSPFPALQKVENKSAVPGEYDYGPLLLVYTDSNNYYLADNIPGQTYYDSPNTYYVQRASNFHVVFIVKSKVSLTTEMINGMLTTNKSTLATFTPTPP